MSYEEAKNGEAISPYKKAKTMIESFDEWYDGIESVHKDYMRFYCLVAWTHGSIKALNNAIETVKSQYDNELINTIKNTME